MHGAGQFPGLFRKEPAGALFCPCRICPMGARSGRQHGKIAGLAVDRGVRLTYAPDPGERVGPAAG